MTTYITMREGQVLYEAAQGSSSALTATTLGTSRRTVDAQRASLIRKLGARNLTHAVFLWMTEPTIKIVERKPQKRRTKSHAPTPLTDISVR